MKHILFLSFLFIVTGCAKRTDTVTTDSAGSSTTIDNIVKADTSPTIPAPFDSAKVSVDNLPATVKPWVAANYPGYTVASAAYDPLCGGGPAIDVVVQKSGAPNYSLVFRPDGSFVQREEDVPFSTAPAAIKQALKKNFADYKPAPQIEELKLSDNTRQYLLDLSKGKIMKEVVFTEQGAIVCESGE